MRGKGESGFSMIELMIVVAILAILGMVVTDSYRSWSRRYQVENDVKEMYASLMDARARAMQTKKMYFVTISGTQYQVYEDSSPAPDGDRVLNAADRLVLQGAPRNVIQSFPAAIAFDPDGVLSSGGGLIRISSPVRADYDCISLGRTRIKMGQMDGGGATCAEK